MPAKPESKLQRKIRTHVKERWPDIYIVKNHGGPHMNRGLLDFTGCLNGLFFGLEIKTPKNKSGATAIQQKNIRDIRAAGGVAEVVTSPDEAYNVLRKALKNRKLYGQPYKPKKRKRPDLGARYE